MYPVRVLREFESQNRLLKMRVAYAKFQKGCRLPIYSVVAFSALEIEIYIRDLRYVDCNFGIMVRNSQE